MAFLQLIPVFLSALLLGAHFLRTGDMLLVALCLLLPWLLLLRRPWVPRVIQLGLAIGALEWGYTTFVLVKMRVAMGDDWARMAVILGTVMLVTAGSAMVFFTRRLQQRYRLAAENPGG